MRDVTRRVVFRWRCRVVDIVGLPRHRASAWLLNHPSRRAWIAVELLRHLPLRQRLKNAWWQWKNYGDHDAFDALWQTFYASTEARRG